MVWHSNGKKEKVRLNFIDEGLAQPDASGYIDFEVSFDWSWMTRDHRSHIGIVLVIDVYTGIVIDLRVLCNHCLRCKVGSRKAPSKHVCHKKNEGKSGAMEGDAPVRIWS